MSASTITTPARAELLDYIDDPDHAYDQKPADLAALQLAAAQELFAVRREQIPLLARRAEQASIARIGAFDDLVPLLFAHTVYKSYPQSFVDQNRWDRMLQWLQTLSVAKVTDVDVSDVKDVDDWLEALWAAGHAVLATSGSSGKCSFLNHTMGDRALKTEHFKYTVGWPQIRSSPDRELFWLGPGSGRNSAVEAFLSNAENWGRPGHVHALTGQPLLISEVSRMAALRKKMADGTATPSEIEAYELEGARKAAAARAEFERLVDLVLDHRHEPIYITGMWSQHMLIMQRARERGIGDGEFHPKSVVGAGGGVKGISLPPDYKEQVTRFYAQAIRPYSYGMTELALLMPRCEAERYHIPPALIALPLDAPGERLLKREDGSNSIVEGRFGFVDLVYEGRWGGIITGDKVTMDLSGRCPCGRFGNTLFDNITRFAQIGQNDHIGCAGTIDAYIRGAVDS